MEQIEAMRYKYLVNFQINKVIGKEKTDKFKVELLRVWLKLKSILNGLNKIEAMKTCWVYLLSYGAGFYAHEN